MMVFNNVTIKIRPKTFSLLMLFLQHPFKVLSKQEILDTIWDDVEVNDQVLFQTIRELRQLFESDEVIKTHPRKGYAWIEGVEEYSEQQELTKSANSTSSDHEKRKSFPWQPLIIMIVFIVITAYYTLKENTTESSLSGTLVILPMKSAIKDNDHQWVYLGAMNQLISQLQSNDTLVVLNTNFILTLMKEAELQQKYDSHNVRRIFDVSGASLVVETELLGSTQHYQLKYALHFKHDIKRGIIFERNINEAIIKLANIISRYSGHSLIQLDEAFSSEFSNELLVRAIELKDKKDPLAASKLLESLVQIEPNNIVAKEMLAMIYLRLERLPEAKQLLINASELAVKADSNELPIVFHHLAVVTFFEGDHIEALKFITIADEYAIAKHDWLYRAYLAQLRSRIEIKDNELDLAYISLNNALRYHGVIQCPVGTSITLLQLRDLAKIQGDKLQAQLYFDRASNIIKTRGLTFIESLLEREVRKPPLNQ
jgi:transcriptional activator of cad operon